MNNEVANALRGLYARFGAQILSQPPRLASLLRDECPERRPEISALVKALEEQVPQDLLNSHSGEPPSSLAARLSKRLSEEHLLAREASNWAVWAWAHGLGLGDEYRSEELTQPELRSQIIVEPNKPAQPPVTATEAQTPPVRRRNLWPAGVAAVLLAAALGYAGKVYLLKPPPPPHISGIDVPDHIRVGKPYTFTIHFDQAPAGVVAIERQVMQSTAKWSADVSNQKITGMESLHQGAIQYDFQPEAAPATSTLQFVLIDRNGQRSQPQVVAYEVTAPPPPPVVHHVAPISHKFDASPVACSDCGTIAAIEKVQKQRKAKGVGAVAGAVVGGLLGHLAGRGRGKTAATAGGAVGGGFLGNLIEGHIPQTRWEITVNLNGGQRQTIESTEEPAWHIGERVRVVDGEIMPVE
jgi:outer membrane lipoprotein SlyB